jgi:hypothetical protein
MNSALFGAPDINSNSSLHEGGGGQPPTTSWSGSCSVRCHTEKGNRPIRSRATVASRDFSGAPDCQVSSQTWRFFIFFGEGNDSVSPWSYKGGSYAVSSLYLPCCCYDVLLCACSCSPLPRVWLWSSCARCERLQLMEISHKRDTVI